MNVTEFPVETTLEVDVEPVVATTVYELIRAPPLEPGESHCTVTPPPVPGAVRAVAVTPVGAPGVVIGTKRMESESGPVPTAFVAVTETE